MYSVTVCIYSVTVCIYSVTVCIYSVTVCKGLPAKSVQQEVDSQNHQKWLQVTAVLWQQPSDGTKRPPPTTMPPSHAHR